jgi:hypothetical protein
VEEKVFMLQNVAHSEDPNCVLLDRRRVLMFDIDMCKWTVMD